MSEPQLESITYGWTMTSKRKANEGAAIFRVRYSDGSSEDVELLEGESLDLSHEARRFSRWVHDLQIRGESRE